MPTAGIHSHQFFGGRFQKATDHSAIGRFKLRNDILYVTLIQLSTWPTMKGDHSGMSRLTRVCVEYRIAVDSSPICAGRQLDNQRNQMCTNAIISTAFRVCTISVLTNYTLNGSHDVTVAFCGYIKLGSLQTIKKFLKKISNWCYQSRILELIECMYKIFKTTRRGQHLQDWSYVLCTRIA